MSAPDTSWESHVDRVTAPMVAFVLSEFPLDIVRRSTVRALLPQGRSVKRGTGGERRRWNAVPKGTKNIVADKLGRRIRELAELGLIAREHDHVRIRNRAGLRVVAARLPDDHPIMLDTEFAFRAVKGERVPAAQEQQRLDELRAIYQLMKVPQLRSGKGTRRFVNVSRTADRP